MEMEIKYPQKADFKNNNNIIINIKILKRLK